jgi:beta-mannosidase
MSQAEHTGPFGRWSVARTAPDEFASPADLHLRDLEWIDAPVPGTVAQALSNAGHALHDHPQDLDASDWWYRCSFAPPPRDGRLELRFGGLATLAEIWLNEVPLLRTDNMFREYAVDVSDHLDDRNGLAICFRSVAAALKQRRPRPRWKTRLVTDQQLRWFRTTLLGRIPGWSPPIAPVGPWRLISLHAQRPGSFSDLAVWSRLQDQTGLVDLSCRFHHGEGAAISGTAFVGDASTPLTIERDGDAYRLTGRVRLARPALWWPHTHGRPSLYSCTVRITAGDCETECDCGTIGFRRVEARADRDGFALAINGQPVFCRGACWTVGDIVSLTGSTRDLSRDLALMRDAGANMIRVGGTMVYEDDRFYQLCDELGLLVWQDFMFANMDYPADDAEFLQSVEIEATQQLERLRRHPSIAVYCGNSEVEQQAAMLGVDRSAWRSRLFSRVLPDLCERLHAGVPYLPSTPTGGDLPFHVGSGVTHYYGVGAYRRHIEDVRRAAVRFTPECLAFANVPEPDLCQMVMGRAPIATHDPRWKQRTPRDTGAGWDFEDVRDHYVRDLFSIDPATLRSADPERYLELGRVTTGEVMARVFAEWRSTHSACRGGLVWFLKDLWPGAGWGVLDSRGMPKACYYYLRRAWQPRAVFMTDEGLDGLHLHVINETDRPLSATLELTLLRDGRAVVAQASTPCDLPARTIATYTGDALLERFHDLTYAYRFGPPMHDIVAAVLYGQARTVLSSTFWVRDALAVMNQAGGAVVAEASRVGRSSYALTLTSERFLLATRIDVPGFLADDNYFCLMPGETRTLALHAWDADRPFAGYVQALNLSEAISIRTGASAHFLAS